MSSQDKTPNVSDAALAERVLNEYTRTCIEDYTENVTREQRIEAMQHALLTAAPAPVEGWLSPNGIFRALAARIDAREIDATAAGGGDDSIALAIARRFTLDTEPQRRASLQVAIIEALAKREVGVSVGVLRRPQPPGAGSIPRFATPTGATTIVPNENALRLPPGEYQLYTHPAPTPAVEVTADQVERACVAFFNDWPSYHQHEREQYRKEMRDALSAARSGEGGQNG